MNQSECLELLMKTDRESVRRLFQSADTVRKKYVGDAVYLRALVEISNECRRDCRYCGIRASNRKISRYRMTGREIFRSAQQARDLGLQTVVLQSGEDPDLDISRTAQLISRIKTELSMAITLSFGERSKKELALFKQAGADRYLLRFETSNPGLFQRIHEGSLSQRLKRLEWLKELGYEIGSGIMVGIPGQTFSDVAAAISLFKQLSIDMIGIGPYIPHPSTPLGSRFHPTGIKENQVPNTTEMTLKTLALTRLTCLNVNIPSTTALESLAPESGFEDGLFCGANVIMPNFTPLDYRKNYEIYPAKACLQQTPSQLIARLTTYLSQHSRHIGTGRGDSPHFLTQQK